MDIRDTNGGEVATLMERILYEVKKVVVGQDHFLERVLVAILAQGHLLVEGVPGLAKTLTVKTLARAVRATLNPTWAISEVGTAGPTGGRRGNSPGHACIAVDGPRARAVTIETRQSDRVTNMQVFARAALDLLAALLHETPRT